MPTLDATPPEHSPSTTDLLRRLRYAQALHQCAQALLQPAGDLAGQRSALTEALEHLRVAAEAGRAALYRNFDDPALGFCSGIFAESCAPGIPSSLAGGFADRIPWSGFSGQLGAAFDLTGDRKTIKIREKDEVDYALLKALIQQAATA